MRESELPPRRTFVPCFVFSVQFGTKSSLQRFIYRAYVTRILATSRCYDGNDNDNVIKAIGWIGKTTTLHVHRAFLYIFLPSLCDYYDGIMPNFTFYGGRKQATTKFSFSLWTWMWFLGIPLKKSLLAFDKLNELEVIAIKIEKTQFHFLSEVSAAVAVLGS